ncbi:MAG: gliding motility lipoprotein GldH [Muribaculaceae bacterium]|nr:gliding motility lipoprotein GldH [Muribaculaceae bacterium]
MDRIVKYKMSVLAAVAFLMASCGMAGSRGNGVDNYFSAFTTFENQEWSYGRKIEFRVDTLRDSVATGGSLMLSLRHTAGYEYSNLWIELTYPSADSISTDTFNITLADDFGHWRGRGSGPSIQKSDILKRDFTLIKGSVVGLRHIMRPDTISGIEQIGIIYLPVKDK